MQNNHSVQGLSLARRTMLRVAVGMIVAVGIVGAPRTAHAQIDPLAIIKRNLATTTTSPSFKTHLLVAMDTSLRMQFDAAGNYYDPYDYTTGNVYDTTLAINSSATKYRRLYTALQFTSTGSPKFETSTISVVGNNTASAAAYANFYAQTRLGVAKAALIQAVGENVKSARFGFVGMRQGSTPSISQLNDGHVLDDDTAQAAPTDSGLPGEWLLTRGKVTADNGAAAAPSPVAKIQADSTTANTDIVTLLNKSFTTSGAILPAGNDGSGRVDAPLSNLLTDLKAEATRLITGDAQCRNTIAVLITGGGEGNSATPGTAASAVATAFRTISSRRVPIYVIALAPAASAVAELQAIAANSGGQYFEVSSAEIAAAVTAGVPVPKVVRAIDLAVQHGMANPSDVNTAPTASLPYGPQSEFLVTSPVVGTVDLTNAKALDGSTLPDTDITSTKSGAEVPQRANVMVTTGFAVPGFDMKMRSYRLYKPATDSTKPTGYKFVNDGTPLWVAQTPMTGYCNDATASCRNIFTALPNGTTIAFTDANASTLSPYLNTWDAAELINYVRTQPLGAVISSTPAFMDPPSLDPPPDSDYPGFAVDHEDRRTLIFIGSNDGMMHAIDGRTGIEVWAFIPFNLLPKLRTLRDGQGVDSYAYFVDTSAKVADVKIGGAWRTMVTYGEGIGGTFYQAFDASLDDMGSSVSPDSDSVSTLLSYFNNVDRIKYLWAFPRYSVFDTTINTTAMPYGDLASTASADEKSVGQTWSDPAVGQIKDTTGPYTIIVGLRVPAPVRGKRFDARRCDCWTEVVSAVGGRRTRLRELQRRQRRARRDRRRLHRDDLRLHEVQERDPGRPGGDRPERLAIRDQGLRRRSRRQGLAIRPGPRQLEEPEVHQLAAGVVYAGEQRAADLLVDGRCLGRHAGVPVRRHRQRPAPVDRRERAVPTARNTRSGIEWHEDVPNRPGQDRRLRRRREGVFIPGGRG
jgi:hypothetical protein